MRAITICCLLGVLCSSLLSGQETFNRRYHFDYAATILNSVIATDSCYYGVGIGVDTVFPYDAGVFFIRFDFHGEMEQMHDYRDSVVEYHTWDGELIPMQDGFLINGYSTDTTIHAMIIRFDQEGIVDTIYNIDNLFGEYEYIVSKFILEDNDKILLATHEGNPNGVNNSDVVLQMFDKDGALLWRKNFGVLPPKEIPHSMVKLGENEYAIGCSRTNSNFVNEDFTSQCYIFGIDSIGNKLWEYYTSSWLPDWRLVDGANAMVATADGGLVVASGRGEEIPINPNSGWINWLRAYIFKLNSDQEIEWELELLEEDMAPYIFNKLRKIIAVSDGSGYILAGHYGEDFEGPGVDYNGWIIKISLDGDSLWSRKLRYLPDRYVGDDHELYDLAETPDGGFLLAGQVKDDSLYEHYQQAWLIKVDEHGCLVPGCHLVGVEEEPGVAQPEVQVMLSPNPAREFVNVFIKDERIAQRRGAQLRVFDSQGRERLRRPAGRLDEVTNMIPVWDWPGGWYVLVYEDAGGVLWEARFVVGE